MLKPQLWIIAGPNGAGKTTLVNSFFRETLSQATFLNPDAITLGYLNEIGIPTWEAAPKEELEKQFIRAANEAQRQLEQGIEDGGTFAIESVLSTRKYCALVERVLELGGVVHLFYLALNSPELSAQRVVARQGLGGHGVPIEKLEHRWKASLELLPWFAIRSTRFWILDNSANTKDAQGKLLVSGSDKSLTIHGVPDQAVRPLVADFITRFSAMNGEGTWRFDITDSFVVEPE